MINLFRITKKTFKNDLLSGLTVALALVPEAVAFSFVAGVEPLVGLYAAFIVGLIVILISIITSVVVVLIATLLLI